MLTILLSILPIITLSYKYEKSWDEAFRADLTCCPLHKNNEPGCHAEEGSKCLWVEPSHPGAQKTDSQCIGEKFAECMQSDPEGCCGTCCGCEKDEFIVPPTILNPPDGSPGIDQCSPPTAAPYTPQPTTTTVATPRPTATTTTTTTTTTTQEPGPTPFTPIGSTTPGDVGDFIDAAQDTTCTTSNDNCWTNPTEGKGQDYDYTPMDIYFTGVNKNSNGNCCYGYKTYMTDRKNCIGKNSAQSHLTFDINCPTDDFEVVKSESSPNVGDYGNDKSTCYYGIKIDEECGDECSYEICINYKTTDSCHYTKSFVLDKAGNAFGFVSLDGLPTCQMPDHNNYLFGYDVNGLYYNGQFGGISQFGWMCFVISVVMIFVIYKYLGKWCDKDGKYMPIKDGSINNYSTFSSV